MSGSRTRSQEDLDQEVCLCDRREALERIMIQERLIPYYAKILAAVPGQSQNMRNYTPEVLAASGPPYVGRPFILDHDYEDSRKVHGQIVDYKYGVDESPYTQRQHTGLWLNGVGMMPEDLYAQIKGDEARGIPPLVRGVSIGGQGDGQMGLHGIDIKSFNPAELSVTAFPGIPEAHIAAFEQIAESIYPKRLQPRTSLRMSEEPVRASVKDFSVRRTTELGPNTMERTPAVPLFKQPSSRTRGEGPDTHSADSHKHPPAAVVPMAGAPDAGFKPPPTMTPKMTPEMVKAVQALAADGNRLMHMIHPNPVRSDHKGGEEEEEETGAYAGYDQPFQAPGMPDTEPPAPYMKGTDPDREPLPGEEEIKLQVSKTKEGETIIKIASPKEGTPTPPSPGRGPAPHGAKLSDGASETPHGEEEGTASPPEPGRDTPLPGAGEEEEEANPILKAAKLEASLSVEQRDQIPWEAHAPSLPPEQFAAYREVIKQLEDVMPKTRTTGAKPVGEAYINKSVSVDTTHYGQKCGEAHEGMNHKEWIDAQKANISWEQRKPGQRETVAKPRVLETQAGAGLPQSAQAKPVQSLSLRETILKTWEETQKELKGSNLSIIEQGRLAWFKTIPETVKRTAVRK